MGTALTESYAADGATFTPAQGLYQIWAALSEFAVSGTTITVKKLDGSTTAMTFTPSFNPETPKGPVVSGSFREKVPLAWSFMPGTEKP